MTLLDFVNAYKGKAKFDVDTLEDGESKDAIVFSNDEAGAVKDDILNSEIVRYAVTGVAGNIPTIGVAVRKKEPVVEEPEIGEQAGETTE